MGSRVLPGGWGGDVEGRKKVRIGRPFYITLNKGSLLLFWLHKWGGHFDETTPTTY